MLKSVGLGTRRGGLCGLLGTLRNQRRLIRTKLGSNGLESAHWGLARCLGLHQSCPVGNDCNNKHVPVAWGPIHLEVHVDILHALLK